MMIYNINHVFNQYADKIIQNRYNLNYMIIKSILKHSTPKPVTKK